MLEKIASATISSVSPQTARELSRGFSQIVRDVQRENSIDVSPLGGGDSAAISALEIDDLRNALRAVEDHVGPKALAARADAMLDDIRDATVSHRRERQAQARTAARDARLWGLLALVMIVGGIIIIPVSLLRSSISDLTAIFGAVSLLAGLIPGHYCLMAHKRYKDANDRYDALLEDAHKVEKAEILVDMSRRIGDPDRRDGIVEEIIRKNMIAPRNNI